VAVVARTYAQALFDAAGDSGRLEQVREDLQDFVAAIEDVPELRALLRNPRLDPATKAEVLDEVLAGADELVRNFLRVVAAKGRGAQIDEMGREFEALYAADQQLLNVELTTAHEVSDADAQEIVGKIEKASGRKVEASRSVDPNLIGGIVVRAGTRLADGSVRGRLNRLRHELATRS
jgi:F-type H+-transporting ATPase subunit delta